MIETRLLNWATSQLGDKWTVKALVASLIVVLLSIWLPIRMLYVKYSECVARNALMSVG